MIAALGYWIYNLKQNLAVAMAAAVPLGDRLAGGRAVELQLRAALAAAQRERDDARAAQLPAAAAAHLAAAQGERDALRAGVAQMQRERDAAVAAGEALLLDPRLRPDAPPPVDYAERLRQANERTTAAQQRAEQAATFAEAQCADLRREHERAVATLRAELGPALEAARTEGAEGATAAVADRVTAAEAETARVKEIYRIKIADFAKKLLELRTATKQARTRAREEIAKAKAEAGAEPAQVRIRELETQLADSTARIVRLAENLKTAAAEAARDRTIAEQAKAAQREETDLNHKRLKELEAALQAKIDEIEKRAKPCILFLKAEIEVLKLELKLARLAPDADRTALESQLAEKTAAFETLKAARPATPPR